MTYRTVGSGPLSEAPPAAYEQDPPEAARATRAAAAAPLPPSVERAFTFALLLSALRCTVQYVLLPFVLPWIGLAAEVPPWVTLALGALALASLVRNLRYLWRLRHAQRWSYLLLALVAIGALLLFVAMDLRALLS